MPVFGHEVDARLQQLAGRKSGNILSLQQHFAGQGPVPAENGTDQFRASRADHAGSSQDLARIKLEGNILETIARQSLYLHDRIQVLIIHGHIRAAVAGAHFHIRGQQAPDQHFLIKLPDRALQRDHAVPHDGHVRCHLKNLRKTVGDVDHTDALAFQVPDNPEQGLHLAECQGAGRLIQDEHLGFPQEAAQDFHQLLLRNGKGVGLPLEVKPEIQLFHMGGQALPELRHLIPESHQDVFFHRHIGEKHRFLGNHIYTGREGSGRIHHIHGAAIHFNGAAVSTVYPHDDFHEGAFACSVSADQRKNLSGPERYADALQHFIDAEGLPDIADRKCADSAAVCVYISHGFSFLSQRSIYFISQRNICSLTKQYICRFGICQQLFRLSVCAPLIICIIIVIRKYNKNRLNSIDIRTG